MTEDLVRKVQRTIDRYRMLGGSGPVVVALSGGVDSMVLFCVLLRLCRGSQGPLHVAHLDHGLRGHESAETAVFVRRQCEARGVTVSIATADGAALRHRPGGSLEAAARDLRYRFLDQVADELGAARIALGHHRDDQAETVLMNLLRGSGTRGLGGIPPVRGRFIRPLIECSREEIEGFARAEGIAHVEDSSNSNLSYRRNRVRLELLPDLATHYNPRIAEALASAAAIFEAEDTLLSAMTDEHLVAVLSSRSSNELALSVPRAAALPTALRRRVIRRSVHLLLSDRQGLNYQQTLALDRLLLDEGVGEALDVAGKLRATRTGDRLVFLVQDHEEKDRVDSFAFAVPSRIVVPGCSLSLEADFLESGTAGEFAVDRWTALLDADRAGRELIVRRWKPGDRFVPLGMKGHKKLQDFFVDEKVPRDKRLAVPLVVAGGEIAWVVGYRVDNRFRVTDSTRRVLRVYAAMEHGKHKDLGGS